ncbi:MAG: hypothetical protein HC927_06510 [Deltaproteobacteria bacterium]|nr:hypothetical protein [Deltaproteobacteria bacterium]
MSPSQRNWRRANSHFGPSARRHSWSPHGKIARDGCPACSYLVTVFACLARARRPALRLRRRGRGGDRRDRRERGTDGETDEGSTTAETGESGTESEDTDSSSEESTDTTEEGTDSSSEESTDTTDDGELFDCLDEQFASGENPGPDYTGLDVIVGSHCLGTNHQDITDIERVVFLGDSVTVGTPPARPRTTTARSSPTSCR